MEYRKITIENKSKDVSLLGFGCMRFPTTPEGDIDKPLATRMMTYAVEHGVNYIDTAYPYHNGTSETFVRDVIRHLPRESFYLADKLPIWDCKTNADVDRIFHEQLDKCGVEYFDFYLIHAVNKGRLQQVADLDLFTQLEQYRSQGKIRNLGFSFHDDLETFRRWVDLYDWDFVQIQLNYMDIHHQQGMTGYDILTERGIPVVIMEPVKGGSLAKFHPSVEAKLKHLRPEESIASWAFRWVGSLPNVRVILSGMSTMEQVEDNIKTFTDFEPLSDDETVLLDEVRTELLSLTQVDCTSCNYCMPCPHGVDIPGNFRIFNHHAMYQNDRHATWATSQLKEQDAFADQCIDCGECLPKCPQHIEIPDSLADFVTYLHDKDIR